MTTSCGKRRRGRRRRRWRQPLTPTTDPPRPWCDDDDDNDDADDDDDDEDDDDSLTDALIRSCRRFLPSIGKVTNLAILSRGLRVVKNYVGVVPPIFASSTHVRKFLPLVPLRRSVSFFLEYIRSFWIPARFFLYAENKTLFDRDAREKGKKIFKLK